LLKYKNAFINKTMKEKNEKEEKTEKGTKKNEELITKRNEIGN
jgi:hypothetical protein